MLKTGINEQKQPSGNKNINIDLQLNLLNTWTRLDVADYYQTIFLVYLDELTRTQAEQLVKKQITLTLQKKSPYFQLQNLQKERKDMIKKVQILLKQAQKDQSPSKLQQMCLQIKRLREATLNEAQQILKMYNIYHCTSIQSTDKQMEYYDSMLKNLDRDNWFMKESVLSKYLKFDEGYDPFLMTQYQSVHRNISQYNPAIKELFNLNISFAYKLIKTKNMILQLRALVNRFQSQNLGEYPFSGRLKLNQSQLTTRKLTSKEEMPNFKKELQNGNRKYSVNQGLPIKIQPIHIYPSVHAKSRTTIYRQIEKDKRPESKSITEGNQKLRLKFAKIAPQPPNSAELSYIDERSPKGRMNFYHLKTQKQQPSKSPELYRKFKPLQKSFYNEKRFSIPYQSPPQQFQRLKPTKHRAAIGLIYKSTKLTPIRNKIQKEDSRNQSRYPQSRIQTPQQKEDRQIIVRNDAKEVKQEVNEQVIFRTDTKPVKQKVNPIPQVLIKAQQIKPISTLPVFKEIKHYNPIKRQAYESVAVQPKKSKYDFILKQQTKLKQSNQEKSSKAQSPDEDSGLFYEQPISKYNLKRRDNIEKKTNNDKIDIQQKSTKNYIVKQANKKNFRIDQQSQTIELREPHNKEQKDQKKSTLKKTQSHNTQGDQNHYKDQQQQAQLKKQRKKKKKGATNSLEQQQNQKQKQKQQQRPKLAKQKLNSKQKEKLTQQQKKQKEQLKQKENATLKEKPTQKEKPKQKEKLDQKQKQKQILKYKQKQQERDQDQEEQESEQEQAGKGQEQKQIENQEQDEDQDQEQQQEQKQDQNQSQELNQDQKTLKQQPKKIVKQQPKKQIKKQPIKQAKLQPQLKESSKSSKIDPEKKVQNNNVDKPKDKNNVSSSQHKNTTQQPKPQGKQPEQLDKTNTVPGKDNLSASKQKSSSKKQIRMKVGKAHIDEVIQLIKQSNIPKEYLTSFELQKMVAWIKVSQSYLTQFTVNDETSIIAICSPIPNIGVALKFWAPLNSQIEVNATSNLFKKYIEFIQKFSTSQKIMFSGKPFKELQAGQFIMKKENLYERFRKTPPRQTTQQFKPFVYIQCSNLKFGTKAKNKMLYSEEIQQFTPENSFSISFLSQVNNSAVPNSITPLIKFDQSLENFKKVNQILTVEDFDNYQTNQIQASNIDLMRFYLNTPLKSPFIAQDNTFKLNGTLLHQKDKECVVSVNLNKNNGNIYFSKNVNFTQFLEIIKNSSTTKVFFNVTMFNKKLYGKMPQVEGGCYGNWQVNLTWQDELQGRIRHNMLEKIAFGPQNFKVLIQVEKILVLGFEVNKQDFI